ncbi:hypothetical protein D3C76_64070 [compost metagenome]
MMEQSAQTLANWAEFNRRKWHCDVEAITFQVPNSGAYGESLFFTNRRGGFYLPPHNPYHPTLFHPTPTNKPYRSNKQWHDVADLIIDRLLKIRGPVIFNLPPEITDIRPFLWRGFKADVKYTYYVNIPYSIDLASKAIRNKIRKAAAEGYISVRTDNMEHALQCLAETEKRQGFSHQLTVHDLNMARELLGENALRCYICYSKDGEPVSVNLSLLLHPTRATGWIAGTKSAHLSKGVVQQLQLFEFEDLASIGVTSFDFTGANIPSVSESKADWGGDLMPYYVIRKPGFKEILRSVRDWFQFKRELR